MWAASYLEVVVFFLVGAPNCIVKTIVIGNESDTLVGVVLEAVVWLLQLITCISVDTFWHSLSTCQHLVRFSFSMTSLR
jgi:hypothetical protein